MAQDTDMADGVLQEDTALLGWTDFTTAFEAEGAEKNHSSRYNLLSDGVLQRTYDYEKPSETTSIVGRNITYLGFTQNGRIVNVVITATEGDVTPRSETLEFSVYLRTEGTP